MIVGQVITVDGITSRIDAVFPNGEYVYTQTGGSTPTTAPFRTTSRYLLRRVISFGANTPPAHVADQEHIVGPSPTGAWANRANRIAISNGVTWSFTDPDYSWLGLRAYVIGTNNIYTWTGTAWLHSLPDGDYGDIVVTNGVVAIKSAALATPELGPLSGLTNTQIQNLRTQIGVIVEGGAAITKASLGLGDVDNTTDLNKPISTATQTALNLKINTSALSNVDNTSDVNKPISTATQTALNLKADTSALGTAAAKNVGTAIGNVIELQNVSGTAKLPAVDGSQLTGLSAAPVSSVNTFTGAVVLTKTDVGLSNVDNTSDVSKPISTATQNALDLKLTTSTFDTALNAGVVETPSRDDAPANKAYVIAQSVAAAAAAGQVVTLTVNPSSAVALNRLCWVDENANVGECNVSFSPDAAPNKCTTINTQINTQTLSGFGAAYSQSYMMDRPSMAELSNGNVVLLRGRTADGRPDFTIINRLTGATVVAWTEISTDTVASNTQQVYALTTGGFVVIYANTTSTLKAAIYSNAGAVVMAAAQIQTGLLSTATTNTSYYWSAVALASGKWAIFYQESGSPYKAMYKIFTSTGSVDVASTQIGSVQSATWMTFGRKIAANGDMIVVVHEASNQIARITSAGVLVGSVQAPTSSARSASYTTMSPNEAIAELDNGNIAVAVSTSDGYNALAIINAGFTSLVATASMATPMSGLATTNQYPALATVPGGVAVFSKYPNYWWNVSNAGTVSGYVNGPGVFPQITSTGIRKIVALPNNLIVLVSQTDTSTNTQSMVRLNLTNAVATSAIVWEGATVALQGSALSYSLGDLAVSLSGDGILLVSHLTNAYRAYQAFVPTLRSVIGVAKAAASVNASVELGASGTFALTHSFAVTAGSGWSYKFDHNANTLTGVEGVVYGDKAVLNGLF